MRALSCVTAIGLIVAFPLSAAGAEKADLVLVRLGTLPIILTAPHGGREPVPGIAPRDITGKPKGGSGYVLGGDGNTDVLVQGIAREINLLTGKDPYLVMARFQRRFIDANRPPNIAFDNAKAKPYYQYYHRSIRRFVDAIRSRYPGGLLIDIHGQRKLPDALLRGTQNGRTIKQLLARAGVPAITGPKGLFGQLAKNGFVVFPANNVPPSGTSENAGFNGGFTVAKYGSHHANGIDAVQLEFGTKYRRKSEIESTAKRTARAIATFYETYLRGAQK
jgi:N-formylglutamate amidohydrolase